MSVQDDLNTAAALLRKGNFSGAADIYTALLESGTMNWLLLGDRASARFQMKDFAGAVADLDAAMDLAKSDTSAPATKIDDLRLIHAMAVEKRNKQADAKLQAANCPACQTKFFVDRVVSENPFKCVACAATFLMQSGTLQKTEIVATGLRKFFGLKPYVAEAVSPSQAIAKKRTQGFCDICLESYVPDAQARARSYNAMVGGGDPMRALAQSIVSTRTAKLCQQCATVVCRSCDKIGKCPICGSDKLGAEKEL